MTERKVTGARVQAGAVLLVAALFAAACGSTASEADRADRGGRADEELTVPDASRVDGDDGTTGAGVDLEPNAAAPTEGRTGTAGRSAAAARSTPGRASTAAVDRGPVKIGVLHQVSQCDYYATAGADQLGCLDERAAYKAVIDDVNKAGGLAGRRLEPVWFEAKDRYEATFQSGCAHLTQDNRVAAVITATSPGRSPSFRACVARAGVPLFDADTTTTATEKTFREQPLYFTPVGPSLDRFAKIAVDGLVSAGFLSGRWNAHGSCTAETKPKLGLVTLDTPDYRQVYERVLGPRFAAAGYPIAEVAFMTDTPDAAPVARDAQAAVLRFASECIDHVVFLETGAPALLFVNAASSQGYTPRYGYGSPSTPATVISVYTNPRVQLRGALGVGWCPICDVGQRDWDAVAQRRGAAECDKVMVAARVQKSGPAGQFYALRVCDAVYFLQAAAAASPNFTPLGLADGASSVGTGYEPVATYRTALSPSRHDGAAAYRTFAFVEACTCYRYTGPVKPF